jgi:molybdate transport system substrate-binding protein
VTVRAVAISFVLAALALPLLFSGCGDAGQTDAPPLTLFCGAGIRPAADALIKAFTAAHGIEVRPSYAGSEMLLAQIDASRKGDLYMPGAEAYVDRAIEMGLADGTTKRAAAYFVPVIFVAKGNPKAIGSLKDLAAEGLRLGFGDERSCAIGKQTLKILAKNEIPYAEWESNVSFKSATVNELPMQIQLGNLDAVISWDANARHFLDDGEIVPIPLEQNVPSTVPLVRLESSQSPEAALAFIEFVTSDQGKGILRDKKYTVELAEAQ